MTTPEYPKAITPLQHMAKYFDDGTIDKDWQPAVEDEWRFRASRAEWIVARGYRNARMRAAKFSKGTPGSNNHAHVPPEWQDPQAVADRLALAMRDEPDTDPDVLLRRALAQSGRMAEPQNECDHCGVGFTARRSDAKFCSPRCRQAAARDKRSEVSRIAV